MNFDEFKTLVDGCGTFSTLNLRLPFPIARKLLAVVEAAYSTEIRGHRGICDADPDIGDCWLCEIDAALAALEEE